MASKNVGMLRAAHESWNKRDFAGGVSNAVKGLAGPSKRLRRKLHRIG